MSATAPFPAHVTHRREAASGQVLLSLQPADLAAVSHRLPGQYVVAEAGDGSGYFALVNAPGDPLEVLVKDGNGAAGVLFRSAVGAAFQLSAAQGPGFPLQGVERGTPVLLVAGGTGVAPLVPLLPEVARRGADVTVLYGARENGALALRERLPEGTRLFVSREEGVAPAVKGRVTDALTGDGLPWTRVVAFLAGPRAMVASSRERLLALGTRAENIRVNF